jgi:hypothetical protein
LTAAASIPGVDLILITERKRLEQVCALVVAGNSAQLADPRFVEELKTWLRFSPLQAIETGDGLFSVASGSPALPAWLGPYAFEWLVRAKADNEKYTRQLRSSAGVAVFVSQREDREHWVLAGRACQRARSQARLCQSAGRSDGAATGVGEPRRNARASSRPRHAVWVWSHASLLRAKASRSCRGLRAKPAEFNESAHGI